MCLREDGFEFEEKRRTLSGRHPWRNRRGLGSVPSSSRYGADLKTNELLRILITIADLIRLGQKLIMTCLCIYIR